MSKPTPKLTGQARVVADSNRSPVSEQGNWWGKLDDADEPSGGHAVPIEGPSPDYEHDLASWKAHRILKDTAEKICGLTFRETGVEDQLTEPKIVPPDPELTVHGRLRYNPKTGYITGPYDTWVQLKDRPREQFMTLVETCIDLWQQNHGINERGADALRSKAAQLKGIQNHSDEEILTELIEAVIAPVPVTEYNWP